MKKTILILSLLAGWTVVQAQTFQDDFNRTDTGLTTSGSVIGSGWTIENSTQWEIESSLLKAGDGTTNSHSIIWNTDAFVSSANSFTVSAIVNAGTADAWNGVAFNVQDSDDFYALRFKTSTQQYQFLRIQNGSPAAIGGTQASGAPGFVVGTDYTVTISYDSLVPSTYDVNIAGGALNVSNSFSDSTFTSGFSGVYTNSGVVTFDDVSTAVIPEPNQASLFLGAVAFVILLVGVRRRRG